MTVPSWINWRALLFVGICVMAVAALIVTRQAHRTDVASVSIRTEDTALPEDAAIDTEPETTRAVVSKAPETAAAAETSTTNASPVKAPAVKPVEAVAVESSPKAPVPELTPTASAEESTQTAAELESTTTADVQNVAPVTITGCLELDDATFWLKDTAGGNVPKSRSWKSGFLRRRPSSIQLVDGTQTLNLKTYVGQRVEATGMLLNREMQASSLQPVAASCN